MSLRQKESAQWKKNHGVESDIDFETVPSCIYTCPELSSVGLTEKQALHQGLDYEVGTFHWRQMENL